MAKNNLSVYIGANVKGLKDGVKEAKGVLGDLSKSVTNIQSTMAGIASMGAFAAPLTAAKQWAAAVNDIEDKTNLAGESASRLIAIGEHVGLTADDMASSIMKMSKTVQTSNEHFGKSSDVFSKYGIAIRDNNGELLSSEQILSNVAAKHREMENGVKKNAMEMEIFGRSGGKLNDLLNLTAQELNTLGKNADDLGLTMSHSVTQRFEDAQFKVNDAKTAFKGMAVSIGKEMLPEFEALADWVAKTSKGIATMSDDERRWIAVGLEGVGTVGSMVLAVNGLSVAYNLLVGAATKAAAAIKAVSVAATTTPIGLLATGLAAAGYAAYNGYQNYNAKNSKGENLYKATYDDNGVVSWERTEAEDDRDKMAASTPTTPTTPSNDTGTGGLFTNDQQGKVGNYQADVDAKADAEKQKTAIVEEQEQARNEIVSAYQALEKEARAAMEAENFETFMSFLDSEQMEKLARLEEERELRQQLYDWRMEAEQGMLTFEMEAGEMVKNQLATGLADLITEGGKLSDVFKNIGKSIVNMFVQFMVKKQMASLMSIMLGKQEAAANASAAAAATPALVSAAVQQSIAQLGPIAGPPAYAAAVSGMMATGTAASAAAASSGASLSLGGNGSISFMATGGIVDSPTLAMIGEGKDSEAVIPLNANSFSALAEGIAEQGSMTNTMIINGDINNAGDLDTIMAEFSDSVVNSMRSA